jgi:hypothetical protein
MYANSQLRYAYQMDANDARRERYAELAEARAGRGDSRFNSLYSSLEGSYQRATDAAQRELAQAEAQWQKSHQVDAMEGRTSGLTIDRMPSWDTALRARQQLDALQPEMYRRNGITPPKQAGIRSVNPMAAKPRDPLGIR